MNIKGGYWGKTLWIDLSTENIKIETFDDKFARKYLGGVGFASKIVSDNVNESIDALGSNNVMVFSTGPFQAATIASAGRLTVGARSPLTGYWGESNCGAHAGPALKRTGFDNIAIVGIAEKPVYLWIYDEQVEIRDATDLWGKVDAIDTVDAIKQELNEKRVSVLTIGQAGENLVRYACITNDKHGFFGRTGIGAVMGSKNLKAIAVKGTKSPPIADKEKLKGIYKNIFEKMKASPNSAMLKKHGQVASILPRELCGLLPLKNWRKDKWEKEAEKISAPNFTEVLEAKPWPCDFCIIGCHRKITNNKIAKYSKSGGLEYESLAMFGSNLLIDDLFALTKANDLCNRYGIDTIEIGGVLGWAFEAYEKGWLKKADVDGVDLSWGNADALIQMIQKVTFREGFGDLLADGLKRCVQEYPHSKVAAVEVLNQAVAAHDPRAYFGQTITTIASTRGSCHLHGCAEAAEMGALLPELGVDTAPDRFDIEKKGYLGAIYQDIQQVWNSLVMCFAYFFIDFTLTDQINVLNAITGWNVTAEEIKKTGERIVALQHLFNLRMGLIPREHNVMPERFTKPHKTGGAAGQVPPWKDILEEYWETKDWPNGIPSMEKLRELGL